MPKKRPPDPLGVCSKSQAEYQLRIYELYERSVHGISDRRQLANSFYLTICTVVVGYQVQFGENALLTVAGVAICGLWLRAIKSYRDINSAKFKVIHEIEALLPLRPYTAEWERLDEGKNPHTYKPFASIEGVIPWVFGALLVISLVVDPRIWAEAHVLFDWCWSTIKHVFTGP
jgi:hypothetical protein